MSKKVFKDEPMHMREWELDQRMKKYILCLIIGVTLGLLMPGCCTCLPEAPPTDSTPNANWGEDHWQEPGIVIQ